MKMAATMTSPAGIAVVLHDMLRSAHVILCASRQKTPSCAGQLEAGNCFSTTSASAHMALASHSFKRA